MQVDVGGNGSDFGAEAGNLVGEHAGSRNLNRVVPVIVVVAKSVCEVENGHFADQCVILRDIEMGWLDTTLRDGVRHEEEIKPAINDFTLLHEALINVRALRRIVNERLPTVVLRLLEESLPHALVDDNERDFGPLHLV